MLLMNNRWQYLKLVSITSIGDMSSVETASSTDQIKSVPDHEDGVHFTPPLYRQRYKFVLDTIEQDHSFHSLLDIGCGTCQLLTVGKYRNPHIQLAAAIDINQYEMQEAAYRLKPLPVEYINFRRETPLHIYLLLGKCYPWKFSLTFY